MVRPAAKRDGHVGGDHYRRPFGVACVLRQPSVDRAQRLGQDYGGDAVGSQRVGDLVPALHVGVVLHRLRCLLRRAFGCRLGRAQRVHRRCAGLALGNGGGQVLAGHAQLIGGATSASTTGDLVFKHLDLGLGLLRQLHVAHAVAHRAGHQIHCGGERRQPGQCLAVTVRRADLAVRRLVGRQRILGAGHQVTAIAVAPGQHHRRQQLGQVVHQANARRVAGLGGGGVQRVLR